MHDQTHHQLPTTTSVTIMNRHERASILVSNIKNMAVESAAMHILIMEIQYCRVPLVSLASDTLTCHICDAPIPRRALLVS
jgi:hypothetical protein